MASISRMNDCSEHLMLIWALDNCFKTDLKNCKLECKLSAFFCNALYLTQLPTTKVQQKKIDMIPQIQVFFSSRVNHHSLEAV